MNSIRIRLLVVLFATLALTAAVLGGVTYRNTLVETEALFDYQLRQMALSLRDQGEIAPRDAQALADGQLDFVIQIWSVDGRTIYATRDHANLPTRALLGLAQMSVNGQVWRTYSVATVDRVIQVAQPVQIRRKFAADAALRSVLPFLYLAPVLGLLVWWMVSRAFAPLRRMAQEVRGRNARSMAALPTEGLPDEVAPMVLSFNDLLGRLGQTLDAQRAFVADAAHELRSPLTALKLQLGLLRRSTDPAQRADAESALSEGIERSSRLVEQLLTLARHEPGSVLAAEPEQLDLAETVRQALGDTLSLAVSRGTEVELVADEPVPVTGHRTALGVLARNLADNAVRYAPPGAKVELRVFREGGSGIPVLQVDDSGPGIAPQERERIFDRFYRPDGSEGTGSGLGMAIVQSVAKQHKAEVQLQDSPLGGLRVTVRFGDSG